MFVKEKLVLKYKFLFFFLFVVYFSFAQKDTISRGTIKVHKPKAETIHIKAFIDFNNYDLSKVGSFVSRDQLYQPFPGVEGYAFPFNYTKYFNEKFRAKEIDLKGKMYDTVKFEVKILSNGKVYIKDKTPLLMMNGVPAFYDEKVGGYELNNLHLNCLKFLKEIKSWEPGYVSVPRKRKFKGETVIKPEIINVEASGTLTIVFSTIPFD